MKNKWIYYLPVILFSLFLNLKSPGLALAGPSSGSYQLLDYGFGAGGIATSSSSNFMLQGIVGEIESASPSSGNYIVWPGLTYDLNPNVPLAPAFTNPSNYYNKLQVNINQSNNPSDTTYAIAVSTDNQMLSNVQYVQQDGSLGPSPFFLTYANWQLVSTPPIIIVGLTPGTTYYAAVAAKRGTFTQGGLGPTSVASTVNPTFTYNLQTSNQSNAPFSVGIGVINSGQVTTSWQTVIATISTNANNGGIIYVYDSNGGLKSTTAGNYTIASSTNNLNSVLEGYGARATSWSQSSGGPMEILSPYNVTGNNVGVLDTIKRPFADSSQLPVANGQTSFELKAKASNTTPSANDYSDVLTVIATGSF